MPTSEAQRTLVKSPPELWAELSDPASLGRHLGELGEIRIARVEPETSVEWEAESASGRVELKPSGWGTKVTLTVVREAPQPVAAEPAAAEPIAPAPAAPASAAPEPVAAEPVAPAPAAAEPPAAEPVAAKRATAEPEPKPELSEPAPVVADPRPRFFARIFRRWRREQPTVEPDPAPMAETDAAPSLEEKTPNEIPAADVAAAAAEKIPDTGITAEETPDTDVAAELAQIEEAMAGQDVALLAAVLDRLGAAHHRPFSRA